MAYKTTEETKNKSNILKAAKSIAKVGSIADVKGYKSPKIASSYSWASTLSGSSDSKGAISGETQNKTQGVKYSMPSQPTYEAKSKITEPSDGYGNTGVRAAMINMGLDNSKIGWDNGYVTYNNMRFKPSNLEDGTSYAPRKEIQSFVNSIYKQEGKTPVKVTDYAAPAGLGSISYSPDSGVMVDGKSVPILYMDQDRAVVDEMALNEAYEALKNRLGIKTTSELYNEWEKDYKKRADRAYDEIKNYKEWEYNPEEDPSYKAYSEAYKREGERAYRDAAARLIARNNGNMTSAAQTVANQQLAYYMEQLADKIPELSKNSYERYKEGLDRKIDNYNILASQAQNAWEKLIKTNELAKEDYKNQRENERKRTEDAKADLTTDYKNQELLAALVQKEYDNAFKNAEARGYFTQEEARLLQIPQNEEGRYLTPNEIKIKNEVQYFNEVLVPQLDYESLLALNRSLSEIASKRQTSLALAGANHAYDMDLASHKSELDMEKGKEIAEFKKELEVKE